VTGSFETFASVLHSRPGYAYSCVNEHLAIRSRLDRDVSAGAFKHADVAAQLMRRDRRSCGAVLDQADQPARFGVRCTGAEPSASGGKGAGSSAAKAEAAPGQMGLSTGHVGISVQVANAAEPVIDELNRRISPD